ncbi:MAG: hypothetical protein ACU85V_12955 [Gammaproteobacteria bacterium]
MSEAPDLRPMLEYDTVRIWLDGLREHWGGDPETDDPDRLPTLEAFCVYVKADPDTIIQECKRINKAGDPRISVKGRRKYAGLIDQFQAESKGSRIMRAKRGNTVRSFLIHNAILLSSGAQMVGEE